MSLKNIWMAVSGEHNVPVLVGCLLVYGLSFIICLLLQRAIKLFLPYKMYSYAADFFFAMAICAYPYSHGTIRYLHGHTGFLVAAVTLVTLSFLFFEGSASPLAVFQRFLKGTESVLELAVRVSVQTLGAFLSYRLVYLIWSLEVTEEHQQLLQKSTCESELHVPVIIGFLTEFFAVLYDTWLSQQRLFKTHLFDMLVKILNSCLLVCAGVHMTGMFMHPAMATGMTWNCTDTNALEHIFVYWISSFGGCYLGVKLHSFFRLPFQAVDRKEADIAKETKSSNIIAEKLNRNNLRQRRNQKLSGITKINNNKT